MTQTIRAKVRRRFEVHPKGYDRAMRPWIATIYIDGKAQWRRRAAAGSHAEAMQAAYMMLVALDHELMAEVHASRSSRHTAKNDRLKAETIA